MAVYDEFIFFRKTPVSSSGTCHRSNTSANAGSPWKQISKAASNRLKNKKEWEWEFHSSHNFHMLIILLQTHTSPWHFSVSQQNSGFAFLSRCDGRNPTEGEKSVALCCEIRVYTHTHTAHSRQGVDRSDIWSCLTGQEKIKKKRGEEKKGREERRGKSLPGFHAFCLLHLSGFEEITTECLACLAQHL